MRGIGRGEMIPKLRQIEGEWGGREGGYGIIGLPVRRRRFDRLGSASEKYRAKCLGMACSAAMLELTSVCTSRSVSLELMRRQVWRC